MMAEGRHHSFLCRLVKPAGASGNVVGVAEAARQPRVGALPANLRATPFGAPSAVQQAARPDINEKHKVCRSVCVGVQVCMRMHVA